MDHKVFDSASLYSPMIVMSNVSWRNTWELYLPFKNHGRAQQMQLTKFGCFVEGHASLGSIAKRAFRAKQMVKGYRDLPVYLQTGKQKKTITGPGNLIYNRYDDVFIEVHDENEVLFYMLVADLK